MVLLAQTTNAIGFRTIESDHDYVLKCLLPRITEDLSTIKVYFFCFLTPTPTLTEVKQHVSLVPSETYFQFLLKDKNQMCNSFSL